MNQNPLTASVTGANIPLTQTIDTSLVYSSPGQLKGRNVTVGSNPGSDRQSEGALIQVFLIPGFFIKIHSLLLTKDNISFGLTSKKYLEILNSRRLPLMFEKVQMACDSLLKGCDRAIYDANFPKIKKVPTLIQNDIKKCSSFIECYKEAQFPFVNLITDQTAYFAFVISADRSLQSLKGTTVHTLHDLYESLQSLQDFSGLENLAMSLFHLKKWIKELKNNSIVNATIVKLFDRLIKPLKQHEIKLISHWLIVAIIDVLETEETEEWTFKERESVQIALEKFLEWLFRYDYLNKYDDLLLFFDVLINKLGGNLWTEDYDGILRRLILKGGQCTELQKKLIEKKRDTSDSLAHDSFQAMILESEQKRYPDGTAFSVIEYTKFLLGKAKTFKTQLAADKICEIWIDHILSRFYVEIDEYVQLLYAYGAVTLISTIKSPDNRNSTMSYFIKKIKSTETLNKVAFSPLHDFWKELLREAKSTVKKSKDGNNFS